MNKFLMVTTAILLSSAAGIAAEYCDGSSFAYNSFCENIQGEIACDSTNICSWVHDGSGPGSGTCDGTNGSNPSCQPLDELACNQQSECTWYN